MSIQKTFIYYCASFTFVMTLLVTTMYIIFIKTDWYDQLISIRIFSIPLVLFISLFSILAGCIFGWIIGLMVKKKAMEIENGLHELEMGNEERNFFPEEKLEEVSLIWERIRRIQARFQEQVKVSQRMANERVDAQEKMKQEVLTQERSRLARELHDSVSQQLFAATMLLSAITQNPNPNEQTTQKQMKLVEEIVNESQSEMRALLLHLRPAQLEGKSLKQGIEELLTELTAKLPMKVIWDVEDLQLDKGIEDHLFRIVQEILSNTLRHAKAKLLELRLIQKNKLVILKIIDDGVGFELSEQKAGSYGLVLLRERVAEIGGMIRMVSFPGKGTSIEVTVPIIKEVE